MELVIFIIAVFLGLFIYFYIQRKKATKLSESNYYYKRFLRNKLQTEKNICELQMIIEMSSNDDEKQDNEGIKNIKTYLEQLQNEYNKEYSLSILKKLKRNNLNFKEKKRFAKILINQSEKLYNVEVEIALFNQKSKNINCILV